jgi:hypothetical protein
MACTNPVIDRMVAAIITRRLRARPAACAPLTLFACICRRVKPAAGIDAIGRVSGSNQQLFFLAAELLTQYFMRGLSTAAAPAQRLQAARRSRRGRGEPARRSDLAKQRSGVRNDLTS